MVILVTGGAGFIGSNIVDRLIEIGYQVVVVDNLTTGKRENLNPAAKFYQLDITADRLKEVFQNEEITHVIHHAAQIDVQTSLRQPELDCQTNILGTINLIKLCQEYQVAKIIYASSAAVYGEPEYLPIDEEHQIGAMSPYGISKHTPEHYLRMYHKLAGLNYTIFRYANVYGPRQDARGEGGVISIFVDRMLHNLKPIIYGDGKQTRDFIFVGDIVEANVKALTAGDNQLINISCCTQDSVNDLHQTINQLLNTNIPAVYEPARPGDIKDSYLDNSRAKAVLNWEPEYDLKAGLAETINYNLGLITEDEVAVTLTEEGEEEA